MIDYAAIAGHMKTARHQADAALREATRGHDEEINWYLIERIWEVARPARMLEKISRGRVAEEKRQREGDR